MTWGDLILMIVGYWFVIWLVNTKFFAPKKKGK